MKKLFLLFLTICSAVITYAELSSEEIVDRLLKYGEDGQIMITYEADKKTIKTIYITAVAPLSTNYTKSRALKKAVKVAQAQAEQALVKFFNSKVSASTQMKTKMTDQGTHGSTKTDLSESFSSKSSSIISSMLKVASIQNRDGCYVAIYVWNNTINAGVKKVSSQMKDTAKATVDN